MRRIHKWGGGVFELGFLLLFLLLFFHSMPVHAAGTPVPVAESDGYRFAGWNTKPDGTGTNYSDRTALDAIGRDESIDALTLYAQWECGVTFNANGGTLLAGAGATADEKAVNGQARCTLWKNINQALATGLSGNRAGYHFVMWNTKPDGSGTDLNAYGTLSGPVTFYAVYYQSDYYYAGQPQVFTAPVDGIYQFEVYGSAGGFGNTTATLNGYGGYCSGKIQLKRGTKLYVYVGQQAPPAISHTWSWNGGAPSPQGWDQGHHGGAGGGATDIRLVGGAWNDTTSLRSRIIVAGGGGGASSMCSGYSSAGHGGGLVAHESRNIRYSGETAGRYVSYGGTQTGPGTGYTPGNEGNGIIGTGGFGFGGTAGQCCGGGGGGWYGGGSAYVTGGGGGSSYILDYPGCDRTWAAYQHATAGFDLRIMDGYMQQGVWNNQGYARITLVERKDVA